MGRRPVNRVCAINYPSRVEGWIDVCGELNVFFFFSSSMNCVLNPTEMKN